MCEARADNFLTWTGNQRSGAEREGKFEGDRKVAKRAGEETKAFRLDPNENKRAVGGVESSAKDPADPATEGECQFWSRDCFEWFLALLLAWK